MRLKNKVAVITGSSRGLGLAVCKVFGEESAQLAMLARAAEELEAAANKIPGAMSVPCDVSDPQAVRNAFSQIQDQLGGIDILINNAAVAHPQQLEEAKDELLQQEVSVNLLGPVYCMREALVSMHAKGGGDIVNITSESVQNPYPYLSMYAATKSALETLSSGIRAELVDSNIRVSVYRSGRVDTTFSRNWDADTKQRVRQAAHDSGFYDSSGGSVSPEIVARTILDMVLLDRSARIDVLAVRGT